jgi:tetratricopeptide (TPR) repeat protein
LGSVRTLLFVTTVVSVTSLGCSSGGSSRTPPRTVAIESPPVDAPENTPPPESDAGAETETEAGVLDPLRLPRSIRLERPREYMVAEVQALEKLLEQTPATAPDRPTLVRRIAISYFELFLKLQNESAESIAVTLSRSEKYFDYQASGRTAADFYVYGLLREVKGDFSGAERAYQQALAKGDASADVSARAHYGRALLAERRGNAALAQEEYKRAVDALTMLGDEQPRDRELRAKIVAKTR